MTLRTRSATLVLAAVFAAAPSLAYAAMACTSCCCPPTPCHETASDCEMALADAPCRDQAPTSVPSVASRTHKAPSFHATLPAWSVPAPVASHTIAPVRGGDLAVLISPLRLSVVLLI